MQQLLRCCRKNKALGNSYVYRVVIYLCFSKKYPEYLKNVGNDVIYSNNSIWHVEVRWGTLVRFRFLQRTKRKAKLPSMMIHLRCFCILASLLLMIARNESYGQFPRLFGQHRPSVRNRLPSYCRIDLKSISCFEVFNI